MKGFAIGRTIFGGAAKAWLEGEITDGEAVSVMEERFSHFAAVWRRLRAAGIRISSAPAAMDESRHSRAMTRRKPSFAAAAPA